MELSELEAEHNKNRNLIHESYEKEDILKNAIQLMIQKRQIQHNDTQDIKNIKNNLHKLYIKQKELKETEQNLKDASFKDIKLVEEDKRKYAIENSKNINKFNNSICIDESGFNIDDIVNKGYSVVGTLINKLIKHNKLHL